MKLKLSEIKLNKHNPRDISKENLEKLKKSIQDFPEMLETRPLIIDENNVVLGGNMRLRALRELGFEEIKVKQVTNWSEEKKKEFIVKDNVGYGEWDWEMLANEWDVELLSDWGLDIPDWESSVKDINNADEHSEWLNMPDFVLPDEVFALHIKFNSLQEMDDYCEKNNIKIMTKGKTKYLTQYPYIGRDMNLSDKYKILEKNE
jgi:hypothetical protein